jgi:ATP-dependent helicase/nuclease subunit A
VQRIVVGPDKHDSGNATTREDAAAIASLVADRIASGDYEADDFLVITSQRIRLQHYAREFAHRSVPIEVDGAYHDWDSLLQELIAILRVIAEPSHSIRVISALEGILCGASHAQLFEYGGPWDVTLPPHTAVGHVAVAMDQLHRWWKLSQRITVAALIERIVDDLALLPLIAGGELGESRAGVLLHVVARIRDQHRDVSSLNEALALIDEMLRTENSAPSLRPNRRGALRLMNLHRAKGLEARVVILASPVKDSTQDATMISWQADDGTRHAALRVLHEERALAAPVNWAELETEDSERLNAERERLLYVATTRAKEELIVSQRRPYSTSSGPQTDDGPWSPLAPLLESVDPTPVSHRDVVRRAPVEGEDFDELLTAVDTRRAAAMQPTFVLGTVTDFSKQNALQSEDDASIIASPFSRPVDEGARLGMEMGSALHAVLDGILRGRTGAARDRYIDAIAWRTWSREPEEIRAENRRKLESLVAAAITSDAWKRIGNGVVLPELPVATFSVDGNEARLTEGVLDALVTTADSALVVDWKSANSVERFAGLRDGYDLQGALYASIVEKRSGLPTEFIVQPIRSE